VGQPREDRLFYYSLLPFAGATVAVVLLLAAVLGYYSLPALREYGASVIVGSEWRPSEESPREASYGLLVPLLGTLATAAIAVATAVPVALAMVVATEEVLPPRLRGLLGGVVDVMAAIPTIVYGLWGLEVLAPLLRRHVYPHLNSALGFLPPFSCRAYTGASYLTAGLLLGVIVVPYIYAIVREAYRSIPSKYRLAAYALGATRYEAVRILSGMVRPAVAAAVLLAFGRAAGETVAVALVVGSAFNPPTCLLAPGYTIASLIANQFGESFYYPLMANALYLGGLLLLAIGIIANVAGLRLLAGARSRAGL